MKAALILLTLCLTAITTGCAQQSSKTTDPGVVINGVRWATRNVAAPGTFANKPEDAGMFYQWNRKKAWNATDSIPRWDESEHKRTEWERANDPSPKGWRIPTVEEFESLLDEKKVSNEWIIQNGVNGIQFTDRKNGNSIFLPAAGTYGQMPSAGFITSINSVGCYWISNTIDGLSFRWYCLGFADSFAHVTTTAFSRAAESIRCVAE
jgi:uncharacterized protein (TIGR02145 family)